MPTVEFKATSEELVVIHEIVDRIFREGLEYDDRLSMEMDLNALISQGCPIDLRMLRDFPTFDFIHDIRGISWHIDRKTGTLRDCFEPRSARYGTVRQEQKGESE